MKKVDILEVAFRLLVVFFANVLLAFATVWFLEPAHLYAGGATGLAQFFRRLLLILGVENVIDLGWFIFFVNIPIVLIGFRYVSKKFAIYSVIAIVVQSAATNIIGIWNSPFEELAKPMVLAGGKEVLNYGGILTLAIFGGLVAGFAAGIGCKYGTSTGGIDVVSQALALHKNISMGTATMIFNVAIAVVGGGFMQGDWYIVLFTLVRMILNSLVMDKVHTSYTYTGLHIFTQAPEQIAKDITVLLNRGCTFINSEGAYSHKKSLEVYCVVSTYEVEKVFKIINTYDDKAFVTLSPVKKVKGRFIKKTII